MTDPESEDDEEDNPTSSKNDRIRLSIKKTKCTLSSENEYKSIPLSADKGANLEFVIFIMYCFFLLRNQVKLKIKTHNKISF